MKYTFDKLKISIFVIALVITSIVILILYNVRPSINIDAEIYSKKINFEIKKSDNPKPFSFPNSSLWILNSKIQNFERIQFKASKKNEDENLISKSTNQKFNILPNSNTSYVSFTSQREDFCLSNIYFKTDIAASWLVYGSSHLLEIKNKKETDTTKIYSEFSTGDTLEISLYNCIFTDSSGVSLYKTKVNTIEEFIIPISSANPFVLVRTNNKMGMEVQVEADAFDEDIDLLKDIHIKNLDFKEQEFDAAGNPKIKNSLIKATIKRNSYTTDELVELNKGDNINPSPDNILLKSLKINDENLYLNLCYENVNSLKVGKDVNNEKEMVKSTLEILGSNKLLIVIYGITMILFGLLTNFIIKKKQTSQKEENEIDEKL